MPNYGDFEIEENDELGFDPHLNLEGGFDDELGTLSSSSKAATAAQGLRDYLIRTNNFGSDNNKIPEIAAYQRDMGMGANAIGIVGPKTRTRAKELGITLPEKRQTSSNNTNAKAAASSLRDYLSHTNSFGSRSAPDQHVADYQKQMGGIVGDGIIGPKTRARANALGVSLPQPRTITTVSSKPKTNTPTKTPTPVEAAQGLKKYLERTSDFGTKANPSNTVRQYQRYMKSHSIDGIVGPITNARAKELGVTLPARPAATRATVNKPATKPTTTTDNKKVAAIGLRDYLIKTKDFGSSKHQSSNVVTYQRGMGMGAKSIGIVGPLTRALAHRMGVTLPANPAVSSKPSTTKPAGKVTRLPTQHIGARKPHKTGGDNQKQAARVLRDYLTNGGDFGTRTNPSSRVKDLQRVMGKIDVDGAVGPKTRARAKQLGYTLPARPAANGKRKTLKPITQRGRDRVRKHVDSAFKSEQQKAKEKLVIIDKLSDAYPDIPIWDTYKWRKRVIDLLKVAAGGKC